mgnify:CR=1 FL=1
MNEALELHEASQLTPATRRAYDAAMSAGLAESEAFLPLLSQLMRIVDISPLWRDEDFIVELIINPATGCFGTRKSFARTSQTVFRFVSGLRGPSRTRTPESRMHLTEAEGHTTRIVQGIVEDAGHDPRKRLLISAAGDGTHGEVMHGVMMAGADVRDRIVVFRMPMGTGNDGADALTVTESLALLLSGGDVRRSAAIECQIPGIGVRTAFNICSIGFDAFVTDTTNRLRRVLPGDGYKLVADLAALFYEPVFKAHPMQLAMSDSEGRSFLHEDNTLLCAMGVSGYRTYGGGKRVLPDERNICTVRSIPLPKKIALKAELYEGRHIDNPAVRMFAADTVTISYPARIPFQNDGEGIYLEAENFPITWTRTQPLVHTLVAPAIAHHYHVQVPG